MSASLISAPQHSSDASSGHHQNNMYSLYNNMRYHVACIMSYLYNTVAMPLVDTYCLY